MNIHTLARRRRLAWLAAGLLAAGNSPVGAQTAPASNGRALAATCSACHGTDGKALAGSGMVALARLPKEQVTAQLRAFRDGSRPSTVMQQIAKGYSEAQIDAIAAYFATVR
ncbi:MAG: c-type cytochrome [Burkholderiaceae bacterium]